MIMTTHQIEKQNWDKQKLEDQNFYEAIKQERRKDLERKQFAHGYLSKLIERTSQKLGNGKIVITMYLKRTKYTKLQ
jgi:hypothetical protein